MEKRNFLNGRFSLSTSNLSGTPAAESTHISHTQQKFPWGDGPLNSADKYIQNDVAKRTTVISKAGLRQKTDPRTFANIQSKGITSRIVKYHGNNSRLNNSLSMNNLYNKPGHFPVVHLKKQKEISCNFNKKNLSMVRIAPPEKTVFQANTRSSILRTGSIVSTIGLQKSDEVSRENRPILHPAVENEIAPTRSVLDDLKEISRKRINSDVLDSNDSLKKYCKELETLPVAAPILQQHTVPCTLYAAVPSKRQREIPLTTVGAQKSPEQLGIKRRMYSNINNDITSSLSSSLNILSAKHTCPLTNTKQTVSNLQSPTHNSKMYIKSNNSLNLEKKLPVTPSEHKRTYRNGETLSSIPEPLLTQTNNKPKLTLFNKNYETALSKEYIENFKNNSRKEFSDICFVKPKPNTGDSNNIGLSENSLIIRTQKSKLALMLSGLSGDLNINSANEIDCVSNLNKEKENTTNRKPVLNESVSTSQTTLSFGTSTTVATKIISSPATDNSNIDKIAEKSVLSAKAIEDQLSRNNSSTMKISTNNDIVKIADVPKYVESLIPNKNDIATNNFKAKDSLNNFRNDFALNEVSVSAIVTTTTTTPTENIFAPDNIPKTSLSNQLTSTSFIPAVGIENKMSSITNVSETNRTSNNNFMPQSNLLQQKNVSITLHSNSLQMRTSSNDINNMFENNPKTTPYFATSFNFNNVNASNMFNSNIAAKPTETTKVLNETVIQNTFINHKISDTGNTFPVVPLQKTFINPESSSKNEKDNMFRPVNSNNSLPKEDTFTKCLSNNGLVQNLNPTGSDVISNTENKMLSIQSPGNQFLGTTTNLNSSEAGFSFKPVTNISHPNVDTNIFGASNTSNIASVFAFGSNSRESVSLGNNAANKFSFGQFGSNKSFSFDEKKNITTPLNIGSSKIELSKSSTFTSGNKVTTNQFSVGAKNNSEIFAPVLFRENESQNVNPTLNNISVDKTFSFGSNFNTKKEAGFSFSGNGGQNRFNSDLYQGETTIKPTITNLYNTVSPSVTNDRLIRKATRRLHK